MQFEIELSGEAPALARAELEAAVRTLQGSMALDPSRDRDGAVPVELPDLEAAQEAMRRLALARRCFAFVAPVSEAESWLAPLAPTAGGVAFRRRAHPTGEPRDRTIAELAQRWVSHGGTIDLDHPSRRFWIDSLPGAPDRLLEEVAAVDRPAVAARRMSRLPFHRPVGLDPRFARAAANLAGAAPGVSIVDPFVGTGALLAEAALLGAEVVGVDIDPEMIRGTARNLEFVGRSARRLVAGDAGAVAEEFSGDVFDALLTDAPYGRSSGTGGETVPGLLARVLPAWAQRIRPGGRLVVVTAGGPDPVPAPWRRVTSVPVRQHRSLTREFRVYRSDPAASVT